MTALLSDRESLEAGHHRGHHPFMTFLVPLAALDRDLAEHGPDRLPQRLAAVDHEQHPLLGIKATRDQVGEQRSSDGRVLGRAFPQAERDLHSVGADPQGHYVGSALELDPVEHHHR
jgi:hypothetical protein